jgi:L-ornithine N5-oxygenase
MFQSTVSQNRNVIHTAYYLTKVDEILKRVVKTHSVDVSSSKGVPGAPISPPESISSSRNGSVSSDLLNLPSSPAPISSSLAAADTSKLREALLSSLGEKPSDQPVRIAVIGGGQSSAECFLNLRSRLADALPQEILDRGRPEIHLIIRKGALHPSDDSPFSNEIFVPAMTTYYHNLSLEGESSRPGLGFGKVSGRESSASRRGSSSTATPDEVVEGRKRILAEAKSTNYAVVNPVTLEAVSAPS